jgi:hypothetical protein
MIRTAVCTIGLSALFMAGCATPLPPGAEPGPHGTMAYYVSIEASEPGARIEADGEYIGETPLTLKVFGDTDGTFHNFGSPVYTIRALPLTTNQHVQIRVFQTGQLLGPEDRIPQRIYFDMNQPAPVYVPVPVYVSPPPVYYGSTIYLGPRYYHGYSNPRYYRGYHPGPPLRPPFVPPLPHHRRK